MKQKVLFGLGIGLSTLFATSLPCLAQSQRYPTNTEIQKLIGQLQKRTHIVNQNPTASETKKRDSFVKAWSTVNKSIAPFLGTWQSIPETSYSQSLMIYPSNSSNRVCIIHGDYPDGDSPTSFSFTLGSLSNGQIRLDGDLGRSIILKQGNHLGLAGVFNKKPEVFKYSFPKPLQQPTASLLDKKPETSKIIKKFNAAGCTSSSP